MPPSPTQVEYHVNTVAPLCSTSEGNNHEASFYDDGNNWKVYRTAKYHRDSLKRVPGNGVQLDNRFSSLSDVFKSKMMEGQPKSYAGTSSSQQRSVNRVPSGNRVESRPRAIPRRRKDKSTLVSPLLSSRSMPSLQTWPSSNDGEEDEDCDNNSSWASPNKVPLASSAPGESSLRGPKREARTMTIFEKALIFDSAGNILSHQHFDDFGTSPEFSPQISGRKSKRRVGRHRMEKKKMEVTNDRMTADDVVMEMMHTLLPNKDVTSELNMHFLGGSLDHDVFELDEDWDEAKDDLSTSNSENLSISTIKFQTVLTKLLFPKDEPLNQPFPRLGTSHIELIETYITSEWIARSMMTTVHLDVAAQYENFAVILPIFRIMTELRQDIMKSIVSTCAAIFEHQNLNRVHTSTDDLKCVSVKGVIAFIGRVLTTLEEERYHLDTSNDESTVELYDQVLECMKFLIRTSPANLSKSDDKLLDKYKEGSESIEATTYSAIGQVVYHLATLSPGHGKELLHWMLRKWPQRNVQLQLFFMRYITGIVTHFMGQCIFLTSELVARVFGRICACVQSPHFLIATEATSICGNLPLMDMYLSHDQALREQVSAALHSNATKHWNKRIRQISDEYFDLLLDFA